MPAKLEARIITNKQYKSDQPVAATFELANTGDEDAHVLTWYTPLEGLWSDCLRVTRNGERVPYDGPLAKRGQPSEEDYVLIPAGDAVQAEVELSSAYQVTEPGSYDVAVETRVADVRSKSEAPALQRAIEQPEEGSPSYVASSPAHFVVDRGDNRRATFGEAMRRLDKSQALAKAPTGMGPLGKAAAPSFNGGTTQQQAEVQRAHDDGYDLAVNALAAMANDTHYKEWFGAYTTGRFGIVQGTYQSIKSAMESTTFTYDLTKTGCKPRTYAYTYKGGTTIWMCDLFWSAPATGTDSKAGTAVHEHSHASAGTDDITYGQPNARQLAVTDSDKAIRNADNFEYFAGG